MALRSLALWFGLLIGLMSLAPLAHAQSAVEVTPEFMRWERNERRLYLTVTLSNLSGKELKLRGEADLATSQYRKRISFDFPLAFQGQRTLEIEGPQMDFLSEDFLVVSLQLYDQATGKQLDRTDKFSVPLPRDPESSLKPHESLLLLFSATGEKAEELIERTPKRADVANLIDSGRHGEILWKSVGEVSNWARGLVEGLNLRHEAVEVVLRPQLVIRFTEAPRRSSLDPSLFSLKGVEGQGRGDQVPLNHKLDGDRLILWPQKDLQRGTRYELELKPGMVGFTGLRQQDVQSWRFTTIGGTAGRFEIAQTVPQQGAIKVSISGALQLLFNEIPDAQSLQPTDVKLFKGEQEIPVQLRLRQKRLLFKPKESLAFNTEYRVEVTGISDQQGRELEGPFVLTFTTEAKEFRAKSLAIRNMYPSPKTRGVSPDTDIWIEFDQNVDSTTLERGAGVFSDKQPVAGTWKAEGNRISFTPQRPLEYNKVYVIRLNQDLKSEAGGPLRKDAAWPFATKKDLGYPSQIDPNVLIFSSSHEVVSYMPNRKGTLKIGVTAFEPIQQVDVNGRVVPVPEDTQVELNVDYYLRQRTTKFQVSVVTPSGLGQKTFTIHYGSKEQGPSFRLISVASVQAIDNVNNEPADQTTDAATKSSITLVPQFQYRFSKTQAVAVKGIVLREKYGDSQFQALEAAFTQLALEWEAKNTWVGKAVTNLGWNEIRTDNSSPALGKSRLIAETFLNFTASQRLDKETSFKQKIKGKYSNTIAEASSVDDEADATVGTLTLQAKTTFFTVKHQFDLAYEQTDAVGKYQDQSYTKAGIKFSRKVGPITPSLNLYQKTTQYALYNPSNGVKLEYTASHADFKVSWPILPKLQLGGEYKLKDQTSNLSSKTFKVTTYGMSLTHIW